jgi:hypothetical protein
MSISYRGQLPTGLLSKVTNSIDGKGYTVSTALKGKEFETVIIRQGLFGGFKHLLSIPARDADQARWVHDTTEALADMVSPDQWSAAKPHILASDEYASASDAGFCERLLQATGEDRD